MAVPLLTETEVSLAVDVDRMLLPGAMIVTQGPKLLKLLRASVWVLLATVIAAGERPGEYWHASAAAFPAATTTLTQTLMATCNY